MADTDNPAESYKSETTGKKGANCYQSCGMYSIAYYALDGVPDEMAESMYWEMKNKEGGHALYTGFRVWDDSNNLKWSAAGDTVQFMMADFGLVEPVPVVEEEAADEVLDEMEGEEEGDFAKTLAATAVTALAAALMF